MALPERLARWLHRRGQLRRLGERCSLAWLHVCANPAWLAYLARRRSDGSRRVIVVGTAHRVGSTWLFNLLRDLGCLRDAIDEAPAHLYRYHALWPGAIDYGWLADIRGWAIFKGHADPPVTAAEAALAHFITVHRDPRDVVVSASFQFALWPVALGGWGEAFRALPPAARIEQVLLDPRRTLLTELERWYRTPYAIQVCYETLHAQPVATLAGLAEDLALPVNRRQIEAVVARHEFARVTGRAPGQEADDPARKGIVGDWRNYFSAELEACFRAAQGGCWHALTQEMGYE